MAVGVFVIVALEGLLGVGKSTTARLLGSSEGWRYEQEISHRNPFLAAFYSDIERYTVETEFAFLLLHFHQWKDLRQEGNTCIDFAPGKDLVFARMNLEPKLLRMFEDLYRELYQGLPGPDLVVYLRMEPEHALERVRRRGREVETDLPLGYLQALATFYEEGLAQLGGAVSEVVVEPGMTEREVLAAVRARVGSHGERVE